MRTVLEAIEDIADETIARMAGTAEKVSEHEPLRKRFLPGPLARRDPLPQGSSTSALCPLFKHEGGLLTFILFFVPLLQGCRAISASNAVRSSSEVWRRASFR